MKTQRKSDGLLTDLKTPITSTVEGIVPGTTSLVRPVTGAVDGLLPGSEEGGPPLLVQTTTGGPSRRGSDSLTRSTSGGPRSRRGSTDSLPGPTGGPRSRRGSTESTGPRSRRGSTDSSGSTGVGSPHGARSRRLSTKSSDGGSEKGLPLLGELPLLGGSLNPVVDTATGLSKPVTGVLQQPLVMVGQTLKGVESSMEKPLNQNQVHDVSSIAFKKAYEFFKKNAVGDPKTREQYLSMLRQELAAYETDEDGTQTVSRGILKNFTDDNYKAALAQGEGVVNNTLKMLKLTKFPDFESFKVAREQVQVTVRAQIGNNVAFPELSEQLLKGLEKISTEVGLEFGLSAAEKEKEQLLMQEGRKTIEQQKKKTELEDAIKNSKQLEVNFQKEKKILIEQTQRQAKEWKARIDIESKLRQEQAAKDLHTGFEERAKMLHSELAESTSQSMQVMKQMQKESKESEARISELLLEQQQITAKQEQMQAQSQLQESQGGGLLGAVLNPVTNLGGGQSPKEGRPAGLLTAVLIPVTNLVGGVTSTLVVGKSL